jgi:hypothetical protein
MELLEELDSLYEATDEVASKKFWAAAKNKQIDEVSFHAAYDEELTELGLMDIFNADGTFTNKGVYGKIKAAKDANPDSWAVKALSKLWALRYVDNVLFKAEEDKLAADRAEREKRNAEEKAEKERLAKEECEVLTQEHKAILPDALKLVRKDLLARFIAAYNISEADIDVEVIDNFGGKTLVILPSAGWGYKVIDSYIKDKPAKLANILNSYFLEASKHAEAKQAAKKAESNDAIDVFKANKGNKDISCRAILLGESGAVYQLTSGNVIFKTDKLPSKAVEVKYLVDVAEPYKVIFTEVHQSSNNYSTYSDSVSYTYYSWDSSEAALLKDLIPVVGKSEGTWSHTEVVSVDSSNSRDYSTMDNIDSWAQERYTSYATD